MSASLSRALAADVGAALLVATVVVNVRAASGFFAWLLADRS